MTKELREKIQEIMFATCPVDTEEPFFWKWNEHGLDMLESFYEQEIKEAERRGEEKNEKSKNDAYHERDMLVCTLTKLFPAYLARHSEEEEWEYDWRWIVYIDLPTGQVSWHIHDSERAMFDHLEVKENNWD